MNKQEFRRLVKKNNNNTYLVKDSLLAFLGGGLLGLLSQGLIDLFHSIMKFELSIAYSLSSGTIVLIAFILTITSFYNDLGQIFGAGLFIPITGFSNSMVSASIEGRSEGPIYGIGSRFFSLSGSVIAFSVFTTIIIGLIYALLIELGVNL